MENEEIFEKNEELEVNTDETESQEVAESAVSEEAIDAVQSDTSNGNLIDDTTEKTIESDMKDAKWYVLHTFSGYENVAKENLEIVIDKYGLQKRIFDIIIPMEDVVEEKNGKRKVVSRRLMPGYVYVKMIYGDDIWHAVTRTRGITGFVGPKGRPLPLTDEETLKMHLEKVVMVNTDLRENDKVEVLDGPLNGFVGTVVGIDNQANKCRVIVEMFGRETPVDLGLDQVKKLVD